MPRLVDAVLADAVNRSASDVHIEPTYRAVDIRYRLDGVLQSVASMPGELAPNIVARLKVMAELLTYRLDIPQEGSIRKPPGNQAADLRVSTFPTIHGEKVVVRIFDCSANLRDLEHLGLSADLATRLKALLAERTGALFFTGPSGSGKTTTIYACLRYLLRASGRQIVTIEDPVEQAIEGISQSQARPGTEFDFARGLRSLLRQDPEVIMIGEVRDAATAATASEAALTGHLVISTLHAGSACGVVQRLLDMGVEPYLLTSSVKGILNQRLVRRLCRLCRVPAPHACGPQAFGAKGCDSCLGSGYRGRLLLAELLTITAKLRQAILAKSDLHALDVASDLAETGTIRSAAQLAVAQGDTSFEEVERVLGPPEVTV
jgi:type II secretory ATPase GspE/PulE/Tfp pilus assembly ATPase PilB-like protein